MSRQRLTEVRILFGLLAVIAVAVLLLFARLSSTQNQLVKTTKLDTSTRVTTVGARCNLTRLDLMQVQKHDPMAAPAYRKSLDGCLSELEIVKAIDARTPK